ncbi:hypothetical protein ABZX75_29130 [Streptomyces sp. NPDC003038]|uniref:hypothetical protein n=1 Tax=unclassified Streptomyces TaxID=2593676 RepID=UPI0033BD1E51
MRIAGFRSVVAIIALGVAVSGCKQDLSPEWEYPKLKAALKDFDATLDGRCAASVPDSCLGKLDRLSAVSEQAFEHVLEYKLLDEEYVDAHNELVKARALRAAASSEAVSRSDPRYPPLEHAVAAEVAAYRHVFEELERLRVSPPSTDGWSPV